MQVWQADFYRRPLQDEQGRSLWELVVCDPSDGFTAAAFCPQPEANSIWLAQQLQHMADQSSGLPGRLQVFRPQSLSLIQAAGKALGIEVEASRQTTALKQRLQQRAAQYPAMVQYKPQSNTPPYDPLALDRPPPGPLPDHLWGDQWRFAAIAAGDLLPAFQPRPIPICQMPEALWPVNLQLPSTVPIPGIVIDGGRQSMQLARWLLQAQPVALTYIPGEPDGLILEAGLVDRWVLTTFDDPEVIAAAQTFRQRLQFSQGLHFLLVQPDDSGMTYSGFWLLQFQPSIPMGASPDPE